jgi:hypothetical protein
VRFYCERRQPAKTAATTAITSATVPGVRSDSPVLRNNSRSSHKQDGRAFQVPVRPTDLARLRSTVFQGRALIYDGPKAPQNASLPAHRRLIRAGLFPPPGRSSGSLKSPQTRPPRQTPQPVEKRRPGSGYRCLPGRTLLNLPADRKTLLPAIQRCHNDVSITRLNAGWLRFFTLTQPWNRPAR